MDGATLCEDRKLQLNNDARPIQGLKKPIESDILGSYRFIAIAESQATKLVTKLRRAGSQVGR